MDSDRRLLAGAVSPDGRLMATGDDRGKVTVYETASREPLGKPYVIREGVIQHLRFSPDGNTLSVGSVDPTDPAQSAVVDLIDPRTRKLRLHVEVRSGGVGPRAAFPILRRSWSRTSCSLRTPATWWLR